MLEMSRNFSPLIELKGITKVYGDGEAMVCALDGIDLSVNSGEFIAIMGTSGSGKSTVMNIIGCLDQPTAGIYQFASIDVGTLHRNQRAVLRRNFLGFIFQGFNLLPRTSAIENVELPLIYRGMPKRERKEIALDALASVGLKDRASHTSAELSGGQQQRVAIARALASKPQVILADEPTGNLDTKTTIEIMELLVNLNQKHSITILMVTHEPEMAEYANRMIQIVDGKIVTDVNTREF